MVRRYVTASTALVLQAIASGYRYGFDIMDVSGLPSGTVYPALRRLEQAALLRAEWESQESAAREGRPARRYYQITEAGAVALAEAMDRFRGLAPRHGQAPGELGPQPAAG
jgi:PadR family transcriptional regulator